MSERFIVRTGRGHFSDEPRHRPVYMVWDTETKDKRKRLVDVMTDKVKAEGMAARLNRGEGIAQ